MRELIQLNPDWALEKAHDLGLSYDGREEFNRRLFVDNPEVAMQECLRLWTEEHSDWNAVQLMAAIAAGYTPMNPPGTRDAEIIRLQKHSRLGDRQQNMQFFLMLQYCREQGADYDNWSSMLSASMYPDDPFNVDKMNGSPEERHAGDVISSDDVMATLFSKDDLSAAETLAAVAAAKRPALSTTTLSKLVRLALQESAEMYKYFVTSLSDAMAPYAASAVASQLEAIDDQASQDPITTETTNRMAVSIAPFNPKAVARYVTANLGCSETHLAVLALGHSMPNVVRELRAETALENRDLAGRDAKSDRREDGRECS